MRGGLLRGKPPLLFCGPASLQGKAASCKLLDFRLQGFMAWQLGNAMRPEITGGCVRYDKIAFVPFPIGAAGFLRFLCFQTVTGRLGLGIGKHLCLKLLFLPDSSVQGFQLGGAVL